MAKIIEVLTRPYHVPMRLKQNQKHPWNKEAARDKPHQLRGLKKKNSHKIRALIVWATYHMDNV